MALSRKISAPLTPLPPPPDDPEYKDFSDITQLPAHRLAEIRRFFEDYKKVREAVGG